MIYHPKDARHLSNTANIRYSHIRHDALAMELLRQSNILQAGGFAAKLVVPLTGERRKLNAKVCEGKKMKTLNHWPELMKHPRVIGTVAVSPEVVAPGDTRQSYGWAGALPCMQHKPLTFSEADMTIIELDGAFLEGESGTVHDGCNFFPLHHNNSDGRWIHPQADQQSVPTKAAHITGTVLTVIQHNSANYYHWMLEVAGRLIAAKAYLQKHGSPGGTKWDNTKILVPDGLGSVGEDTLRLLLTKKERRRIHHYQHAPRGSFLRRGVQVDRLLSIVWRRSNAPIHEQDGWSVFHPPRAVIRRVHKEFCGAMKLPCKPRVIPAATRPTLKIVYVCRVSAGVRKVTSDNKVLKLLREVLDEAVGNGTISSGQVDTHFGNSTLEAQATQFSDADIVIGPHGAGLSNMLFSPPGCHVVLLPLAPDCLDASMAHLAFALDHFVWSAPWLEGDYYGEYSITNHRLVRLKELMQYVVTTKAEHLLQPALAGALQTDPDLLKVEKGKQEPANVITEQFGINCSHFLRPVSHARK